MGLLTWQSGGPCLQVPAGPQNGEGSLVLGHWSSVTKRRCCELGPARFWAEPLSVCCPEYLSWPPPLGGQLPLSPWLPSLRPGLLMGLLSLPPF